MYMRDRHSQSLLRDLQQWTLSEILKHAISLQLLLSTHSVRFIKIIFLGLGVGFAMGRRLPDMYGKLLAYGALSHAFTVSGMGVAAYASYSRLTGYWDNGLRWNVPKYQVNKFDITSRFEENTAFKRFKINTD